MTEWHSRGGGGSGMKRGVERASQRGEGASSSDLYSMGVHLWVESSVAKLWSEFGADYRPHMISCVDESVVKEIENTQGLNI